MNLEKNLRKEFQKKSKGQALLGQLRFPFGPASGPACLPLLLSPARGRASLHQRWPRGGRTPALDAPRPASNPPGRDAGSGSQTTSLHSVACLPLSLPPPLAPRSSSSSSARHCSRKLRRSHQSPNLDAKSTSALAVARVSSCERSTEVRVHRAP